MYVSTALELYLWVPRVHWSQYVVFLTHLNSLNLLYFTFPISLHSKVQQQYKRQLYIMNHHHIKLSFFVAFCVSRLSTIDAALGFKPRGRADMSVHSFSNRNKIQIKKEWDLLANDSICSIPRGGSNDELETDSPVVIVLLNKLGHILGQTIQAFSRALEAGIASATDKSEVDEDGNQVAKNPIGKVFKVIIDMIQAAFDTDGSNSRPNDVSNDFANKLCKSYGISLSDNQNDDCITIQSGSLSQALQKARSQAQLLVVYIPSSSKPNKAKTSNDYKALKSLVSKQVQDIANKPSISKSPTYKTSFAFWATSRHDAKEAIQAKKQLKIKTNPSSKKTKKNHPILLVVYPSLALDKYGTSKITPRVLAQHHCNPPPSETNMASWLNALRKRHKKQYANMQHEIKEMELFQERQRGYKKSILEDTTREVHEKEKEERKLQLEKERQEKELALQERRKELRENLPEEPSSASGQTNIVTIALRFTNGKKGQRRFLDDVKMEQLFNWVDAEFELERETVVLTTMNGSKSFDYDSVVEKGLLLKDSGLGKMAALRVTIEVKNNEGKDENDDEDDDDESSNSDEEED
jgi:hypothetical protein